MKCNLRLGLFTRSVYFGSLSLPTYPNLPAAEAMYQNLRRALPSDAPASVHFCSIPEAQEAQVWRCGGAAGLEQLELGGQIQSVSWLSWDLWQ
jgi:hypothetical protein